MKSFTIPINQAPIEEVLALEHEGYELTLNMNTQQWEAHKK